MVLCSRRRELNCPSATQTDAFVPRLPTKQGRKERIPTSQVPVSKQSWMHAERGSVLLPLSLIVDCPTRFCMRGRIRLQTAELAATKIDLCVIRYSPQCAAGRRKGLFGKTGEDMKRLSKHPSGVLFTSRQIMVTIYEPCILCSVSLSSSSRSPLQRTLFQNVKLTLGLGCSPAEGLA